MVAALSEAYALCSGMPQPADVDPMKDQYNYGELHVHVYTCTCIALFIVYTCQMPVFFVFQVVVHVHV